MSPLLRGRESPAHLYIEVFSHSVDSDSMESSVCQVGEDGAEHVWTPVGLKVIPDLQTPWTQSIRKHVTLSGKETSIEMSIEALYDD